MNVKQREGGNAVTLTLLGLSVAILAGMVALYFIGRTAPEKVIFSRTVPVEEDLVQEEKVEDNKREGWRLYEEKLYGVSFEYPVGWVVATGTLATGDPAISISKATDASTNSVFGMEDVVSHVSIYPQGVATEGIRSTMQKSSIVFGVDGVDAQDFVLQSGRPWATKVSFSQYPESWNEYGFVFARLPIEGEELVYMRGGTVIEQYEFDPFAGDIIERSGIVDNGVREEQEEILRSITFPNMTPKEVEVGEQSIIIEFPREGDVVQSPLLVKGQVRGGWYYNDDFLLSLETSEGQIVTQVGILPEGEWSGQESLPFEVSMIFTAPQATSGMLYIGRTIFSKSFKDDAEVMVPVLFEVGGDN